MIGTWKMVEAYNINDPKQPTKRDYLYGRPPVGYWVYDTSGHFSLQFFKNPTLPIPEGNQNWLQPDPPCVPPYDLMLETFTPNIGYSYFGTFTVDYERSEILHHVIGDAYRSYTGTVQPRPFTMPDPNTLIVGDPTSYIRKLVRLT